MLLLESLELKHEIVRRLCLQDRPRLAQVCHLANRHLEPDIVQAAFDAGQLCDEEAERQKEGRHQEYLLWEHECVMYFSEAFD